MAKRMYKKGLVVGIIILFIGVGFTSGIGVNDKTSNESSFIDSDKENPNILNGPDLKVEKIYTTWGWKGNYWVHYITCDVINIGEPIVDGSSRVYSEVWRWKYLTQTYEPWGYSVDGYPSYDDWGSNETKSVRGAFGTGYSNGLYRIKFNVKTSGDVNPENNDFIRYFQIKNERIIPSNPFDAPEEGYKEFTVEDCDCKEVSEIDLDRFDMTIDRLESYRGLLSLLSKRNSKIAEYYGELSNSISTLTEIDGENKTAVCVYLFFRWFTTGLLGALFLSLTVMFWQWELHLLERICEYLSYVYFEDKHYEIGELAEYYECWWTYLL